MALSGPIRAAGRALRISQQGYYRAIRRTAAAGRIKPFLTTLYRANFRIRKNVIFFGCFSRKNVYKCR